MCPPPSSTLYVYSYMYIHLQLGYNNNNNTSSCRFHFPLLLLLLQIEFLHASGNICRPCCMSSSLLSLSLVFSLFPPWLSRQLPQINSASCQSIALSVARVYPTVLRPTVNYDRPHIINQSVRADVAARCCHRRSPSCHLVSINTRKLSRAATAPKLSCSSAQWCSQAIQCEICTEFKSKNSSAPTAIAWVRH